MAKKTTQESMVDAGKYVIPSSAVAYILVYLMSKVWPDAIYDPQLMLALGLVLTPIINIIAVWLKKTLG